MQISASHQCDPASNHYHLLPHSDGMRDKSQLNKRQDIRLPKHMVDTSIIAYCCSHGYNIKHNREFFWALLISIIGKKFSIIGRGLVETLCTSPSTRPFKAIILHMVFSHYINLHNSVSWTSSEVVIVTSSVCFVRILCHYIFCCIYTLIWRFVLFTRCFN